MYIFTSLAVFSSTPDALALALALAHFVVVQDGYESDVSDEEALEPPKPNRPPIHLSRYSLIFIIMYSGSFLLFVFFSFLYTPGN